MDFRELSKLAYDLRKDTVDMIVAGKGGHIGGDMSVMETLVTLYFDQMNISPENMNDPDRDLFVMSKGHSVEAYYAVLAKKGFLDIKEVNEKFSKFGTQYIGHELRFSGTWTSGLRRHGTCRKNEQEKLPCIHSNG